MNKILIPICLLLLSSLLLFSTTSKACDSYESAFPPPYPDSYPCMDYILSTYAFCCDEEFDNVCIERLREYCDENGNAPSQHKPNGNPDDDCWFDQCKIDGPRSQAMPHCPDICPAYETSLPPPGPNPPGAINGLIFEIVWYDGFCCQDEWDQLCYSLMDSLVISPFLCNDEDPSTADGCHPQLGCTHTPISSNSFVQVQLSAILEGPYDYASNRMNTDLREKGLLPLSHPFNEAPWNYNGSESVGSMNDFPSDMVDWVLVEIRDAVDRNIILSQKAAILLSDGSIVSHDGSVTDGIAISGVGANSNYNIVVASRNHLDIVTPVPVFLSNIEVYDFSTDLGQALSTGSDPSMADILDFNYALYAGDMDGDGTLISIDYSDYYLVESASVSGYYKSDLNMDGQVTVADFNLYQPNAGILGASFIAR